jgi:hypothetical protein
MGGEGARRFLNGTGAGRAAQHRRGSRGHGRRSHHHRQRVREQGARFEAASVTAGVVEAVVAVSSAKADWYPATASPPAATVPPGAREGAAPGDRCVPVVSRHGRETRKARSQGAEAEL